MTTNTSTGAEQKSASPLRLIAHLTVRLPALRKSTISWTPPAKTVSEKGGRITVRFT